MSRLTERMNKVIRQDVRAMHAYAVQDAAGLVKLDAMENPFRLPEALQRELGARLGQVAINRYPGRCVADVIKALTAYVDLPAGCKLMLGNGSDELISLLALACDEPASADGRRGHANDTHDADHSRSACHARADQARASRRSAG